MTNRKRIAATTGNAARSIASRKKNPPSQAKSEDSCSSADEIQQREHDIASASDLEISSQSTLYSELSQNDEGNQIISNMI